MNCSAYIHRFFLLCFLTYWLLIAENAFAKEPMILILNSDQSLLHYSAPQEAFQKAFMEFPVSTVSLSAQKWTNILDIEEMLWDENPDLIYAIGSKAYLLANKFVPSTPIVFSSIAGWRRLPKHPAATGVSQELHAGQELMLFRSIFPEIRRIGVLYSEQYTEWFQFTDKVARNIGLNLLGQTVSIEEDVVKKIQKLLPNIDAFWLISDPELFAEKTALIDILRVCDHDQIPVFSQHESLAELGATFVVVADDRTIGRQAAKIAAKLLSGDALEQIQWPAGTYTILNIKKVDEYNVKLQRGALKNVSKMLK